MTEHASETGNTGSADSNPAADRLLGVLQGLLRGPDSARPLPKGLDLDCRLDADLGLDSLSRTELMARVEREFAVRLPEQALLAETPGALLEHVLSAERSLVDTPGPTQQTCFDPQQTQSLAAPIQAATLLDVLQWHVARHPQRIHLYWYGDEEQPEAISYQQLWRSAQRVAAGLQQLGVRAGDRVALMLPSGPNYFYCFFGALAAGAVPAPIYPPTRPSQIEEHLLRHARILDNAGARVLISFAEAAAVAHLLKAQSEHLRHLVNADELVATAELAQPAARLADDLAFLQYTSGSTGNPKGVMLTHAHLLANIRAMGQAVQVTSADVFVSWLPLYHDMGLIGAWLGSLYFGCTLVVMSPLHFLARPSRWLWAIHRHRGTLSAAPNFAYELCLSRISPEELEGLDLSSWRWAFNGAEPVSPQTLRRFAEQFQQYAFQPTALAPVFGLAEAAVGLAFPPPGRGVRVDHIDRDRLRRKGEASPLPAGHPRAQSLVGCGYPLPGYALRILDARNQPLPERREGRLVFRGPSATTGYFANPEASAALYCGDWLETGDRAYLADGEIFISGRSKEMIIRGGRNLFPYELEQAVAELPGVRKGCIAVFAAQTAQSARERLVIVAETRLRDAAELARLQRDTQALATQLLGEPADDVLLLPPHSVLKTSSGKIRRAALRERYEAGQLGDSSSALWLQLARVALSAGWRTAQRWGRRGVAVIYALYALSVFALLVPGVWLGVIVLPRPSQRWRLIRAAIRGLRRAAGVKLRLKQHGAHGDQQVFVANHASYIDVLALIEVLPGQPVYVAKREFEDHWFTRWFLQRLDTVFVERFDLRRSAAEPQRFVQALNAGHSLMFFPEGTFRAEPGLLPFRMGAFLAAAEAGAPIRAVALAGAREILRAGERLPRHGLIDIHLSEPIRPVGNDWDAALGLREQARAFIAEHCGETDLDAGR